MQAASLAEENIVDAAIRLVCGKCFSRSRAAGRVGIRQCQRYCRNLICAWPRVEVPAKNQRDARGHGVADTSQQTDHLLAAIGARTARVDVRVEHVQRPERRAHHRMESDTRLVTYPR